MYNKNLKRLGIILSYLLHPMIISSFTFWYLIYYSNVFIENPNSIFFISFFFSTILPIITVLILKTKNLISDLDASKKGERLLPMAFGALFLLMGFIILRTINSPKLIQGIMFCGVLNTILAWLITKYWKISIHALALATSITIFWVFGYKYLFIILILIILLIIARMLTNSHNIQQIIAGILIGILSTFTQLSILFI